MKNDTCISIESGITSIKKSDQEECSSSKIANQKLNSLSYNHAYDVDIGTTYQNETSEISEDIQYGSQSSLKKQLEMNSNNLMTKAKLLQGQRADLLMTTEEKDEDDWAFSPNGSSRNNKI